MAEALGVIGIGATIAGGITGAQGAKQTAAAQKQMYDYQAGVADLNSKIALQNADYARNQGEQQATIYGIKSAQTAGKIKVGQAASGLDVNSGSNLEVQKGQKKISDMDVSQIRSNAAKTAYDYDTQADSFTNQAGLYRMGGDAAIQAGNINAASAILGTVSSVSSKWLQGNQVGLWGS